MLTYPFKMGTIKKLGMALFLLLPLHLFTQNQPANPMKTLAEKIIFGPIADQLRYREVDEEDIQELEATLGFEIPFELKRFYREKGSFYYWAKGLKEEDTNVVISAEIFKVDQVYSSHYFPLQDFLSSCIGNVEALGDNFLTEKEFLNSCFAVYASIDEEIERKRYMEYFYFDALGNYGSLRFENREGQDLSVLINELVANKANYEAFMKARQDKIEKVESAERREEAAEQQRQLDYLEKYHFRAISYQEALTLLEVENLFGYHDLYDEGEEGEFLDEAYEEDYFAIYYADRDVVIQGDFKIPEAAGGEMLLILVNGDLTVSGKMYYSYYVTGNATFDFLDMNNRQMCLGKERVKYVQVQAAEDHEASHLSRPRKVTAPYFFSWFYDLKAYEFSPETCIYGLYSWYDQRYYSTDNPYFIWQETAFALNPDLIWTLDYEGYDGFNINTEKLYQYLKEGKDIFIDGFDQKCLPFYRKGKALLQNEEYEAAFLHFKKVMELSPRFYLAYLHAGICLKQVRAYAQMKIYYQQGIDLMPAKVTYPAFKSAEGAALGALILEEYEEVIALTDQILRRNDKNGFALRLKAEAVMKLGDRQQARSLLLESIALEPGFTNHWLLGYTYFQEGDTTKANEYFQIAKRNNAKAKPYSEHQDLSYFYGANRRVDWEAKSLASISKVEKNQTYWNTFFQRKLEKSGNHLWGADFMQEIPEEYRSRKMLETLLDYDTTDGRAAKYFPLVIDKVLALRAVGAANPCPLSAIPLELIDKEVCMNMNSGVQLADVPRALIDYDICYQAVKQWASNLKAVPYAFRDEDMYVAAIVGGALENYSGVKLSKRYYEDDAIFRAIDISMEALERIPPRYINKAIYQYALAKYGETAEWKELVARFDRDAYKKNGDPEFDYQTFDRVWACFWDEQFILNAINAEEEGERVYQLPRQYFTQRIADAAIARYSYDLAVIPEEYINPELCRLACNQDYGNALEFVPLPLRTAELCSIAVGRDGENLGFVPDELKTVELCIRALADDSGNIRFIPYTMYPALFEVLLKRYSHTYKLGFIYRGRGIGAFYEEAYEEAIADFQKVQALDEDEASAVHRQHSLYYEAWANFRLNRLDQAKALFQQATSRKNEDFLTKPLEVAALPPVFNVVHSLNKFEFESTMQEIRVHLENEDFESAIDPLEKAEQMLTEANYSDKSMWAIVWDQQRYALYETGRKEMAYSLCEKAIAELSKVTLWDYLEEFNPIRHSLRAMHNMLAYRIYEEAEGLDALKEGLEHSRLSFSTISPIEEQVSLYPFYETKALLLDRARKYEKKHEKNLERLLTKIKKLELGDKGFLSETFKTRFGL